MALEDLLGPDVFWGALVRTNPEGTDPKSQGDDHIRGVKNVALNTNPRVNAAQNWSAFENNQIITQLNQLISAYNGTQLGAIGTVVISSLGAPDGFLQCAGGAYNQLDYPALYAFLGDTYTLVPNATDFQVPDYRGYFLRGTDSGAGRDPDVGSRAPRQDGISGGAVGTTQLGEYASHAHNEVPNTIWSSTVTGSTAGAATSGSDLYVWSNPVTQPSGGNETRAINIYVNFYIRAIHSEINLVALGDDPA